MLFTSTQKQKNTLKSADLEKSREQECGNFQSIFYLNTDTLGEFQICFSVALTTLVPFLS